MCSSDLATGEARRSSTKTGLEPPSSRPRGQGLPPINAGTYLRLCPRQQHGWAVGTGSGGSACRGKGRWSGCPGRTAQRTLCLAQPRAGHCRPPRGPLRTALPLRSGRREQLSSGRAKLEGTRGHPDTLPRGHSPPRPGPKDRAAARCVNTAIRERGGAAPPPRPATNQRAAWRGQNRKRRAANRQKDCRRGWYGKPIVGTFRTR